MKSIVYLFTTLIICVLANAQQISQDELEQIRLDCSKEFDITNDLMAFIRHNASSVPENSNTEGYAHCVLTKTGVYDPISGINEEQAQEVFGGNVLSYYGLCKKDQGNLTPEAFCFEISICVLEYMINENF